MSLNIDGDLTPFEWIVPCGLGGVAMTSVQREAGPAYPTPAAATACASASLTSPKALGARQRLVTPQALERANAVPSAVG